MLFSLFRPPTVKASETDSPLAEITGYHDRIRAAQQTECPDLHQLAQSLGITTSAMSMRRGLCGWIAPEDNGWHITYNADHKLTRQRFTLAHMIGHHFFHRDLMNSRNGPTGANDSLSYRQIACMPYYNPTILPKHETQASRFAIGLIMPAPIIQRLIDDGLNVFQIANRLGTSVQATAIRLRAFNPPA